MHLRKIPSCLAAYAGADLDFLPEECIVAPGGAWLPAVPTYTPRPWWATLKPELADMSTPSDDTCLLITPDVSQAVSEMESYEQDWSRFATACRRVVQQLVSFDGSIDCASLGIPSGHRLYNCFTALIAIVRNLQGVTCAHGGDGGWLFAVMPPHFCLRRHGYSRPGHLPAELARCARRAGD